MTKWNYYQFWTKYALGSGEGGSLSNRRGSSLSTFFFFPSSGKGILASLSLSKDSFFKGVNWVLLELLFRWAVPEEWVEAKSYSPLYRAFLTIWLTLKP